MKNNPKKILLICNHFAPDNTIAAVRITKLAKYFSEYGYCVDVLTECKPEDLEDRILSDDVKSIKVYFAYPSYARKKAGDIYSSLIRPVREPRYNNIEDRIHYDARTGVKRFYTFQETYPIIAALDYSVTISKNKGLFHSVKGFLRSSCDYDYCIASYGEYFGLYAGLYYKKHHPKTKLITEFRDPVFKSVSTPIYYRPYAEYIEKASWKNSNLIVALSNQMKTNIPMPYRKKAVCVTNGYDRNDRKFCLGKYKSENKMTFCYTGSMYGGVRDISVISRAISELINENLIASEDIEIRYAGSKSASEFFFIQADKYGMGYLCKYFGNVERIEALDLQSSSDILLLSAWDYKDDNVGNITGKALEYMSADKPVVTVINGDIEKGRQELGIICEEAKLGCVYYESADKEDYPKLKNYILSQYNTFKSGSKTLHNPDYNVLKRFSYDNIVKEYIKLLENL